jgi:Concanavalin A-like lectin/glucanases superfamily
MKWHGGRGARGAVVLAAVLAATVAAESRAQSTPDASGDARVGEWRFDEIEGQTALDAAQHSLDGQLGSSAAVDAADPTRIAGASSGALRFNGASFVRLPDRPELDVQSLTADAVVRAPASPGSYRYVVSRGSSGCYAGSYGLYTGAAGGIAIYVYDGTRYVVSATARPADVWDGRWHHVAGTFDGRSLRLYVDGQPVGDAADVPMLIDYASTASGAYFGRFVGDCELAFTGDMDMVRLWSGALSADAVVTAARAEGAPVPPDSPKPLPAAAPPTVIPASSGVTAPVPPAGPPASPGMTDTIAAPPPAVAEPACALRVARTRVRARRRTVVGVRVELGGRPVRAQRVVARRAGRAKVLTSALTSARGRARLVLNVRWRGRVRISASRRRACATVDIRVSAPR